MPEQNLQNPNQRLPYEGEAAVSHFTSQYVM